MKNIFNFNKNGNLVFLLNIISLLMGAFCSALIVKGYLLLYILSAFIYSITFILISCWWDGFKL